jgi:transposase-like protein
MLNWETPRHVVRCTHCGSTNTSLVLEFLALERYSCSGCSKTFEVNSNRAATLPKHEPEPPQPQTAKEAPRLGRNGAPAPRIGMEPAAPSIHCPTCQTEHVFRVRIEQSLERWLCGSCGLQFQMPARAPAA